MYSSEVGSASGRAGPGVLSTSDEYAHIRRSLGAPANTAAAAAAAQQNSHQLQSIATDHDHDTQQQNQLPDIRPRVYCSTAIHSAF